MSTEKKTYSLAQLNQSLERFIRDNFAYKHFWVVAEITKTQEKNGHHYLELADSVDGKRVAEMSANMWFSTFTQVNRRLNNELVKLFKAGNKVLLQVKIEFHTIYGLKLNIIDVDPDITYGDLERQKKETIKRLEKEHLINRQQAQYLPPVIKKIALIGSPNTSGYRDFMTQLLKNDVFNNFKLKEFPAAVQGEKAIEQILNAIAQANLYNVDAIVIVRGGGSKMDLHVFNDYQIAKAIALSNIPVITGIGHETDESVADLVAFRDEITPTAVAKFLYVRAAVFRSNIETSFDQIIKIVQGIIAGRKEEFYHLNKYLGHYAKDMIVTHQRELGDIIHEIHIGSREKLDAERSRLRLQLNKIGNEALNKIELKKSSDLDAKMDKIQMYASNFLDQNRIKISNLNDLLAYLNPEELLRKGYTISSVDDQELNQLSEKFIGKKMRTLSHKWLVESEVKNVKPNQ
ncbi:MAG: exodeoxyribonuclease VII large subunit [Crocinitomicaceae bacterium]